MEEAAAVLETKAEGGAKDDTTLVEKNNARTAEAAMEEFIMLDSPAKDKDSSLRWRRVQLYEWLKRYNIEIGMNLTP